MLTPIVNKYINKVLGKLTKMLSDETTISLKNNLGESTRKSSAQESPIKTTLEPCSLAVIYVFASKKQFC